MRTLLSAELQTLFCEEERLRFNVLYSLNTRQILRIQINKSTKSENTGTRAMLCKQYLRERFQQIP